MIIDDGGPAFARAASELNYDSEGMSLRDWYIGQSIGAIIIACKSDTLETGETREQMFARKAVAIADALLSARKEKEL